MADMQQHDGHLATPRAEGTNVNPKSHPRPNSIGHGVPDAVGVGATSTNYPQGTSTNSPRHRATDGAEPSGKMNRGYSDVNQGSPSTSNPALVRQKLGRRTADRTGKGR